MVVRTADVTVATVLGVSREVETFTVTEGRPVDTGIDTKAANAFPSIIALGVTITAMLAVNRLVNAGSVAYDQSLDTCRPYDGVAASGYDEHTSYDWHYG